MNEKDMRFVVKYWRTGGLDVKKAWRLTLQKAGRPVPNMSHRWLAAAAVAACLVIGGGAAWLGWTAYRPTTLVAEAVSRSVTLADGTRVTLAPHATLAYRGRDCRNVAVTGKVYLDIHHDARRPFIVSDDDYEIRDVGTRLMIDERQEAAGHGKQTTVYVEQGTVSLKASQLARAATVTAGELYEVSRGGRGMQKADRPATANMTAWATGEFHFNDTPVGDVLRELSEYYHADLSCDSRDARRRLTADFHADSLDTVIGMIEDAMDIHINNETTTRATKP